MDKYNCKWPRWFAQNGAKTNAVTLGQTTYFSESEEYVKNDTAWKCHEDKHKEQWRRYWYIGFLFLYCWYQVRYGYQNNPFEIEARKAEK